MSSLFPHQQSTSEKPVTRFYGRRASRPVRAQLAATQAALATQFGLNPNNAGHFPYMPLATETWLEIGFGGGEHLVGLAQQHPNCCLIGAEAFSNGVAQAYGHLAQTGASNVRIWPDDVRLLLPFLPMQSLQRVYLLFPDPWPKKRHTKRRFLQPEMLALLAQKLSPAGQLFIATDHAELAEWMCEQLHSTPHFSIARQADTPPDFWVTTRFQQKAILAGRTSVFISAIKN